MQMLFCAWEHLSHWNVNPNNLSLYFFLSPQRDLRQLTVGAPYPPQNSVNGSFPNDLIGTTETPAWLS